MRLKQLFSDHPLLLEWFIWVNIAFLAADIYVAHMVNHFAHWAEWIPFIFSLVAPLLLIPALRPGGQMRGWGKWSGFLVGWLAIMVGIAGFFWHLESQFFQQMTLKSLVYTAPFVAPLAYAGLGFLLLLNRMVPAQNTTWAEWIIFFAAGGFLGNFILAAADHAQNGFFHWTEWLPVISSAFGLSFLSTLLLMPTNRRLLKWAAAVMVIQICIGIVGFGLHLLANLNGLNDTLRANFIYGAPIFAPLLFINIALLAGLGLWDLSHRLTRSTETPTAQQT